MLKPDANELRQVLGFDPDRQPPLVERFVIDIADTDAGHAQPVLFRIERAERLAERLAHAVAAIRAYSDINPDLPGARIETDRMIGRCKHQALDAGAVRGFEHIVTADDIGFVDRLPRTFDRMAAEMHDAVDSGGYLLHLPVIGEVGGDEFLAG